MQSITRLFGSYKTTIVLLIIYASLMAFATVIEKILDTTAAKAIVYYSPMFIFLQLLLIVNFTLAFIEHKYIRQRKWALVIIHLALIVVLVGALITHIIGKEGSMHIREGEKKRTMMMQTSRGMLPKELPFSLELTDFRLNRYPGTNSPSSYESDLKVHMDDGVHEAKVYMNNVLDMKGYRFFQASYDEDEKGTILSVSQDVAGRTVTYFGYLLLGIGFLLMFFSKNSRFWKLFRQLKELQNTAFLIPLLLLFSIVTQASNLDSNSVYDVLERNSVPPPHANKFGKLPVLFKGRVVPMSTFSSEVLRKLHKSNSIGSLNSNQFLLGLLAYPQMWTQVPFLAIANEELTATFNLTENYYSYPQVFDEKGEYKFRDRLNDAYHKPLVARNKFDKDIIKADEQINTLYLLLNAQMPALFPSAGHPERAWYAAGAELTGFSSEDSVFVRSIIPTYLAEIRNSIKTANWTVPDSILAVIANFQIQEDDAHLINPSKIQAEVTYNRLEVFSKVRLGYLMLGGILFVLALVSFFYNKKWFAVITLIFKIGVVSVSLYHLYGIGLRWYIAGYAPWSNSYETVVYVGWIVVLIGLFFWRKNLIITALTTLFGGVILFVSGLNWMDPQISPLVPVLKSPWLMFHVAVIITAYGFFGFSFLIGLVNMLTMAVAKKRQYQPKIQELTIINNLSLLIGLALMTIGTFLGAVWANESWGRYWGWDPKETWALITIITYTIVTHLHLVKKWDTPLRFNVLSVLAFLTVLMTYFGVNYLLSGMHSYG